MALKFTVHGVQSFIKGHRKSGVISIKHSRDIELAHLQWNNVLPVTATVMCCHTLSIMSSTCHPHVIHMSPTSPHPHVTYVATHVPTCHPYLLHVVHVTHTHAVEILQSRTDPPNGTVISAEAGASNVTTLCCDIHKVSEEEEPQQVVSMWFLENYRGQSLTLITMRDHNDTILLHGDLNTGSFLFATYQNKLTFLQFDSDFGDTVLICGRGDSLNIGRFPLVVFSKYINAHIRTYVRTQEMSVIHDFQLLKVAEIFLSHLDRVCAVVIIGATPTGNHELYRPCISFYLQLKSRECHFKLFWASLWDILQMAVFALLVVVFTVIADGLVFTSHLQCSLYITNVL